MTMPSGKLIVFEGLDGAGKSVQIERLASTLVKRGLDIHVTAEPSSGSLGQEIRRRLRQTSPCDEATLALLFAADRMDHVNAEITPALDSRKIVLCDRYVMSSLAYQSAMLPMEWVRSINQYAVPPDLTIMLEISVEEAIARRQNRAQPIELLEHQLRQEMVFVHYQSLLANHDGPLARIDSSGSFDQVEKNIQQAVFHHFPELQSE